VIIQNSATDFCSFFYKKKDQPALDLLRGLTPALRTLILSATVIFSDNTKIRIVIDIT
jgi:hypothetical protein